MAVDADPSSASTSAAPPWASATGVNEAARFVLELEFVQCLANPQYLNWLALNAYLDDPAFLSYLKYLDYWRSPTYAQYIRFPHCLLMLELLQSEHFRRSIATPTAMEHLHSQQAYFWMHHRTNRINEAVQELQQQQQQEES